jgi:hypothetical protein
MLVRLIVGIVVRGGDIPLAVTVGDKGPLLLICLRIFSSSRRCCGTSRDRRLQGVS